MTGAIVLATEQGLGYLALDFYKEGVIDKVFIQSKTKMTNHYEWYKNEDKVRSVDELVEQCDRILMFETPIDWTVILKAREKGVKTILMPMYECTNDPMPYQPNMIISPSLLDLEYYPDSKLVQVPVPRSIKWRKREKAKVFVHNAGNGGMGGRNGTQELLEAMQFVQSPIKLIVRSQRPIKEVKDDRIEYRIGTFDDIWSEGDVFIFPEKFNGLSLPIQEAYASGMLVMSGDRFPFNEWLPNEPLIPVQRYHTEKIYQEFNVAHYEPMDIADKIDEWYNKDISKYSLMGKKWGEENSWDNLKNVYDRL